jgi:DNA-binding transcriptional LysR family regulator
MELRNLHTFLAVADALHFTRAAEALGYAQSSVTAQIQALEAELEVPLFERLGKRVALTPAGERLQAYARRLTALEEELKTAVPGTAEPAGLLRVGSAESLCAYRLPRFLKRFRERHPRVRMVFNSGADADLRRDVAAGTLDVAFFMDPTPRDDGLAVQLLRVEPIRVVALPDHPLAGKPLVTPQDLAGEPILHTEQHSVYRIQFDRVMLAAGVTPQVCLEFTSIEAIRQCTLAGMGIAVLPEMAVAPDLRLGKLVALPWVDPDFHVLDQMAVHKDKWLSPALAAFTAMAREEFAGS